MVDTLSSRRNTASAPLIVAGLSYRLWERELSSLTKSSLLAVRVGVLISFGLTALMGALLAGIASSGVDGEMPAELFFDITRVSFTATFTISLLVVAVLIASVPPRTALKNMLDTLPVSSTAKVFGQDLPTYVLAFAYAAALSSMSIVLLWMAAPEVSVAVLGTVALITLIPASQVFAFSFQRVLSAILMRWLHFPEKYALSASLALLIGLAGVALAPELLEGLDNAFVSLPWILPRVFASLITSNEPLTYLAATLSWIILIAGLTMLSYRLDSWQRRWAASTSLFVGSGPQFISPVYAQFWLDFQLAVRSRQFGASVLAALSFLILIWWATNQPLLLSVTGGALGFSAVIFPYFLGLYAFGRTLPHRWIINSIYGTNDRGKYSLVLAYFCSGLILSAPLITYVLFVGLLSMSDLTLVLLRSLLVLGIALAVGSLLPITDQQSISAPAASFLAASTFGAISIFMLMLEGHIPGLALNASYLALCLLFYSLYFQSFIRNSRGAVTRI